MEDIKTIEALESHLADLITKKNKLEFQIKNCEKEDIKIILLTSYAAVCGLIVDIQTAVATTLLFLFGALIETGKLNKKLFELEADKTVVEQKSEFINKVLNLKKNWE